MPNRYDFDTLARLAAIYAAPGVYDSGTFERAAEVACCHFAGSPCAAFIEAEPAKLRAVLRYAVADVSAC